MSKLSFLKVANAILLFKDQINHVKKENSLYW